MPGPNPDFDAELHPREAAREEARLLEEARRHLDADKQRLLEEGAAADAQRRAQALQARAAGSLVEQNPAMIFPVSGAVPSRTPVQELNRQSRAAAQGEIDQDVAAEGRRKQIANVGLLEYLRARFSR